MEPKHNITGKPMDKAQKIAILISVFAIGSIAIGIVAASAGISFATSFIIFLFLCAVVGLLIWINSNENISHELKAGISVTTITFVIMYGIVCFFMSMSNAQPSSYIYAFFITAILSSLVYAIKQSQLERNEKIESAYRKALKGTDRDKALQAGREYYSMLRKGKLTMYDEQALNNDLNTMVVTIKPDQKQTPQPKIERQSSDDVLNRLEKLGQLKAQGILTDEEFNTQKAKILTE